MIWLLLSPSVQACCNVSGGAFMCAANAAIWSAFHPARWLCHTPSVTSAMSTGTAMKVRTGSGRKYKAIGYSRGRPQR